MSESDSSVHDLDAWLAGDLDPEERKAFEATLECPQDDEASGTAANTLLFKLDRERTEPEPLLEDLIDLLKTQPGANLPAPNRDSWKKVLTPSDDPDLLGTLGDYEVLDLIATGGMGIVFKARDPKLNRVAAVKALSPELAALPAAHDRFLHEARSAAKLEHENILPIHGVHEDNGIPYFAMRFAAGGTLQDAFDRDEMFGIQRLKSIAPQVAAALQAAHDKGIIHRDIKPGNILFDEDGEKVWVCDFGIACSTEEDDQTSSGTVAGTPHYMSPEQADGRQLDGRSDLFSLGAVLYHCATGEPPFSGTTAAAILQQVAKAEPKTANEFNPALPKWFANLLGQLLRKTPRDRPRNAAAVIRAIDDEHAPRPKARQRRRRLLLVAAGAILLAALLLQVPAIRSLKQHAHAALSSRAILVESRFTGYDTIDNAILAARDGDVITLPPGEAFDLALVDIPRGKSITIRSIADRGPPPVITTSPSKLGGFVVGGSLNLQRVNFAANGTINRQPLFLLGPGTSLKLDDCRISAQVVDAEKGSGHARVVELRGGGDVELTRSEIVGQSNIVAIGTTSGTDLQEPARCSVVIKDTTVRSGMLVHLRHTNREEKPELELKADRLDYEGRWILKSSPNTVIPMVEINLLESQIATSQNTVFFQTDQADAVLSRLRLREDANTYPAGNAYVEICTHEFVARRDRKMIPLASFDPSTGESTGSGQPGGSIVAKETGEQFASLMEALANAPEGSTLILSGRIAGPNAPMTDPRSLNLEAAPGTRPIITVMMDAHESVRLLAPCSVRGIRFEGLFGRQWAQPLLDIDTSEGEAVVEDCEFINLPYRGSTHQTGLVIRGTEEATVRRCVFRTPGGSCVLPATGSARIRLDSCLLTGRTAFERRNRDVSPTRIALTARHCSFVCDYLVDYSTSLEFHPVDLDLRECLLDIARHTFHLEGIEAQDLPNRISWKGDHNIHSPSAAVLDTTPGKYQAGFEKTTADSFDALRELGVKVEITAASHRAIFDREHFHLPITPTSLSQALQPDIDSPAAETLRDLAR